MNRLIRLWLLIAFCLAWPAASHAQDRAQITRQITLALTDIALIERERARPDVPDDFAANMLMFNRQQLAEGYAKADRSGQGRAIRQEAQRNANRLINAPRRTSYLRYYPDPMLVRTDVAATAGSVTGVELEGRKAGRLSMLDSSLAGLQGSSAQDDEGWPADVRQRARLYRLHFYDVRDRVEPTLEPIAEGCSRIPFTTCLRRTFHETRGEYRHDLDRAQEVAERYFPREFRARFIDATGIGGSRERFRQDQERQRAEREQQEARTDPFNDEISSMVIGVSFMIVILGGVALLFWLASYLGGRKEGGTSGNYGTADYASPLDARFDEGLFKGVFLGPAAHPGIPGSIFAPIVTAPESHTLIVAPSGTGKGTRVIVPTLLLYTSSLITIDPKGENAAITARYRRDRLGHKVHILNPWGVHDALYQSYGFERATFNPLDVLDPKDKNAVGIATSLAVTICHQGSVNDSFWQDNATAMLAGILLWVAYTDGETKTLERVADIVSGGEDAADLRTTLFPRMVAVSAYRGAMRKFVGRFVQMDDKTYSGVIAQLSKSLQFLADDQITAASDESSFNLAELVDGKTTLYIVIPDDQMQAQAIWLKLMITAVTQVFKRHRPAANGVRGMFLIDEFPVLGRVDSIVTDIALVRGAGLDVTLIVQGLDQLHATYGASANTIISNCGYKWFCNIKDLQTAEYVSKALGQMTVRTVSQTISAADGKASRTFGEMGKSLIFPDELLTMGRKAAFAFRPGGRAFYIKPLDYWHLHAYLSRPGTPPMPDLKAYDDNPFFNQNHYDQGGKKGGAGGAGTGGGGGQSTAQNRKMDRAEALALLGLEEGASAAQVREAYKNLMAKLHPDKGGTNRLAQMLNEARDLLLGKK